MASVIALVVILIVAGSIAIPLFTGHDEKVLAEQITLNNINVQAALGVDKIQDNTCTETSPGVWRIVMKVSEDRYIVVITDVIAHQVLSVTAQTADNKSQQKVLDLAMADPRVVELLNTPDHGTSISTEFTSEEIQMLKDMGLTDTAELFGFTVWVRPLPGMGDEYTPNTFVVDINAGTVIYLGDVPVGGELSDGLHWRIKEIIPT